jgi:hypothetical protein
MLRSLGGQTVIERSKSLIVVFLAALAAISLLQTSMDRITIVRGQQDRENATDVATQFAVAVTTYDFAHPSVQLSEIGALSSASVFRSVVAASTDLVGAKASSVGAVTKVYVATVTGRQIEVLVRTSQVVGNTYVRSGTELAGLLDVTVSGMSTRWIVTDYQWLIAPAGAP